MKKTAEDTIAVGGLAGLAIWIFVALPMLYGRPFADQARHDFWWGMSIVVAGILVMLPTGAAFGLWMFRAPLISERRGKGSRQATSQRTMGVDDLGVRNSSLDLISKARDETSAQVTSVGLTLLGTTLFCLLSLMSPDSALLGDGEKINVPFAGPVSFLGFTLLAPAVLIALRAYLEICIEHGKRLDRIAWFASTVRAPIAAPRALTLVPLRNPLIGFLNGLIVYLLLPLAMVLFAWKAAVFLWGVGLFILAVVVITYHVMSMFSRCSWKAKVFWSASAGMIAGLAILVFGPPYREFDLVHANLAGQWLPEGRLPNADLTASNLRGAYLGSANLRGAILESADLSSANLVGSDLSGADLNNVKATNANLSCTIKLHCAVLSNAKLRNAKLNRADLSNAILDKRAELYNADLSNANLSGADLSEADLSRANLSNANLSNAKLSNANLTAANLSNADLTGSSGLTQAQLDKSCGSKTILPQGFSILPCS